MHDRRHKGICSPTTKISLLKSLPNGYVILSKATRNTEVWILSLDLLLILHVLMGKLIGLRPFGVSLLYAGYDPHYNFQLYHSDPSGNYSGWKATCVGANSGTAQSLLKQEYKDDITMDGAIDLVLRVMSKTMDSTTLGSEKRKEFFCFCCYRIRT